jgi:hypothetical protein
MKRNGQAALEFITTYGWAFVIILTAIAALSYFGVLKPPIADRCIVAPEFMCQDYRLLLLNGDQASAEMILANGKDFNMNISDLACTFPNGNKNAVHVFDVFKMDKTYANLHWEPGEKRRIQCNLTAPDKGGFIIGDKAKVRYTLTYANEDVEGFNHTVEGEVISEVVTP